MPRKCFDPSAGVKTCPCCKETKPLDQFFNSKVTLHGYSVYCKTCTVARHTKWAQKNPAHNAALARKWRTENKERFRDHGLKARYGIPIGTYERLYLAQKGRCAICGADKANGHGQRFHVDHDHTTGQIRALLCSACNSGIGHLQHDKQILLKAIAYLQRYSPKRR